jgi:signal peptidase II
MRSIPFYAAVIAAVVGIDQWIKQLVEANLPMHQAIEMLPFLALYRTYNTGVAFSMFSWIGDTGLIIVSACVIAFVLWLASRSGPGHRLAHLGFALIIGGALGNVIDRALLGHVIDYVLFHTPVWSFAVFNLADAFITVGAILVVADEFFGWGRASDAAGEPNGTAS